MSPQKRRADNSLALHLALAKNQDIFKNNPDSGKGFVVGMESAGDVKF